MGSINRNEPGRKVFSDYPEGAERGPSGSEPLASRSHHRVHVFFVEIVAMEVVCGNKRRLSRFTKSCFRAHSQHDVLFAINTPNSSSVGHSSYRPMTAYGKGEGLMIWDLVPSLWTGNFGRKAMKKRRVGLGHCLFFKRAPAASSVASKA